MRARSERSWMLGVAAVLLLAACTPKRPEVGYAYIKDIDPKRYPEALERFTSSDRVYEDLETRILVTSVYRAWSYRDAYVDEVARRDVMPTDEREQMKAEEKAGWEIYHSFVITLYTPETRHSELTLDEDKVWTLRLYDSKGNHTEPVVISRIDTRDKTFYEYLPRNLWGRTYLVKFPRERLMPRPTGLTLQMSGALGVAEMKFDLSGEPHPDGPALEAKVE